MGLEAYGTLYCNLETLEHRATSRFKSSRSLVTRIYTFPANEHQNIYSFPATVTITCSFLAKRRRKIRVPCKLIGMLVG